MKTRIGVETQIMETQIVESNKLLKLLGGTVEIVLYELDNFLAKQLFEDIEEEAIRLQKIFNFFDPNSELSKLNKRKELFCSDELLYVIKEALKYCELTDGLYDISKGKDILLRKTGNLKNIKYVKCSYKNIIISNNLIKLTNKAVLIDLGSIAKGYIVDKLVEFIQKKGVESGFIDARGDMRIFGKHLEILEIQHPRNKLSSLLPLILENKAIATSGDYTQYTDSFNDCHILGKTDFNSVTVLADSSMKSDVLATCIFLVGKNNFKLFLSNFNDVSVISFDDNLNSYFWNDKSIEFLCEVNDEF